MNRSTKRGMRCLTEYLTFILLLLLAIALISSLFVLFSQEFKSSSPTALSSSNAYCAVVLDAGHGGEDCGAIGHTASGEIYEKDINLSVALMLRDLLVAEGIPTILTRQTDVLLYDHNSDYEGRKKVLDLAARLQIGQSNPDALFVSIHMNAFPQTQYHGLQVYYSPNHPLSQTLALQMQTITQQQLQPDNSRKIKRAGSEIFLLEHLDSPAVLVECGFLSNAEECNRLSRLEYRQQLAFLLFCAIKQTLCNQPSAEQPSDMALHTAWTQIFLAEDLIFEKKYGIMKNRKPTFEQTEECADERNQDHLYLLGMRAEKPQVVGALPLVRCMELLC